MRSGIASRGQRRGERIAPGRRGRSAAWGVLRNAAAVLAAVVLVALLFAAVAAVALATIG